MQAFVHVGLRRREPGSCLAAKTRNAGVKRGSQLKREKRVRRSESEPLTHSVVVVTLACRSIVSRRSCRRLMTGRGDFRVTEPRGKAAGVCLCVCVRRREGGCNERSLSVKRKRSRESRARE